MNVIDVSSEFTEKKKKENPIDPGGKVTLDSCYNMAENLVKLCSSVGQKVELISNDLVYLADKISKQNMESMT